MRWRFLERLRKRAMRGVKVIEKRGSQELMDLLGLEETRPTGQSKWTAMVLTRFGRFDDDVLREALDFEVV